MMLVIEGKYLLESACYNGGNEIADGSKVFLLIYLHEAFLVLTLIFSSLMIIKRKRNAK